MVWAPESARVARLAEGAPELASLVERLSELAAQERDPQRARELAHLAELALVGNLELVARLEAAQTSVEAATRVAVEPEEPSVPVEEAEPEARAAPTRRTRARRETPPSDEENATEESEPSPEERLRARLAWVAARVADADFEGERAVAAAGIETLVIEADHALAQGMSARADELVGEAERMLSSLSGERPPATPSEPSGGFVEDARSRLGARARYEGSLVSVRVDTSLTRSAGGWSGDSPTLEDLRVLLRAYPRVSARLVRVELAGDYVEDAEGVKAYLEERLQASGRVRWGDGSSLSLPRGVYLVLRGPGG